MPWSQPLSSPIELKDGRLSITLGDAANLFGGFSESMIAHGWMSYAIELPMDAAEGGSAGTIEKATVQVKGHCFGRGCCDAREL
jgi:hypothetical protein